MEEVTKSRKKISSKREKIEYMLSIKPIWKDKKINTVLSYQIASDMIQRGLYSSETAKADINVSGLVREALKYEQSNNNR